MAMIKDGKVYRNLQEQVAENTKDIEHLLKNYGYFGPYEALSDIPTDDVVDKGLYLIGTAMPYAVYKYDASTTTYNYIGNFNTELTVDLTWGSIEGTLANQTDLQDALDDKADLNNASQHITTNSLIAKNGTVAVQEGANKITHIFDDHIYRISYNNTYYNGLPSKNGTLAVTDDIPTKTSDLTNDSGFVESSSLATVATTGDYDDLTDKPDLTVYATKTELNGYIKDNDTAYSAVFRGKGAWVKNEGAYTATSYGDGSIGRSVPNQPGYTYDLPNKSGTFAMTNDIPTKTSDLTNDSGFITEVPDTYVNKITVNNVEYTTNNGNITLPDYPDEVAWGNINGTLSNQTDLQTALNAKADLTNTSQEVIADKFNAKDSDYVYTEYGTGTITNKTGRYTSKVITLPIASTLDEPCTLATTNDIPTKTSDLTNDSGFITEVPSNYVTTTMLSDTLDDYALVNDLPTAVSELTNDSGYTTQTWVENQGYAKSANLATVATTGNYNDLTNKPTLFSGDYNDLANKPSIPTATSDLTNDSGFITSSALSGLATETYVNNAVDGLDQTLATVAKTGSYSDLSNKPDLSIYELKTDAFSGDYGDLTNKPDLSVYELKTDAFSGNYNDLTNKPDLSVYAESANLATVATTGDYDDLTNKPTIPTATSQLTNDSGYITGVAWNDVTNKPTFATVATTGAYSDLTGTPTIPDAVSGTNDGTNWTTLTIGSDTYGLASGGSSYTAGTGIDITNNEISVDNTVALKTDIPTVPTNVSAFTNDAGYITSSDLPTNYVTTDTTQTITGSKTLSGTTTFSGASNSVVFTGRNPIKMKAAGTAATYTTGFTFFTVNDEEKAYVQYNPSQNALYMGRYESNADFGYLVESGANIDNYRILVPNSITGTGDATSTANTYYIPVSINGTKANSAGEITISLPTKTSDLTNDSGFITSSSITGPVTLFSSASGDSSSSIQLSDTVADYEAIDIQWITSDGIVSSKRIYNPNDTYVTLEASKIINTPEIDNQLATYYILGSILQAVIKASNATTNGAYPSVTDVTTPGTNVLITKVIGYTSLGLSSSGSQSNLFLHNFQLKGHYGSKYQTVQAQLFTKSSTPITTFQELITQLAAMQSSPYNDTLVGVFWGQYYIANTASANGDPKMAFSAFGVKGTAASPELFAANQQRGTVAYGSTPSSANIGYMTNFERGMGTEQSNYCYDNVTPLVG